MFRDQFHDSTKVSRYANTQQRKQPLRMWSDAMSLASRLEHPHHVPWSPQCKESQNL